MEIEKVNEIPFFDSIEYRIRAYEFSEGNPPLSILVVIKWIDRFHEIRVFRFRNTIIGFEIPYPTSEWIYNPPAEIEIGLSKYFRGDDGIYRR
jgi:hypothetical protein